MTATGQERVRVEVAENVATVTLSRPEKHNALDIAMFEAIVDAAERLADERAVRAVVLCGEGPSFCSGIDLAAVLAAQAGSDAPSDGPAPPAPPAPLEPLRGPVPNFFQRATHAWIELPVPVIAAVHGNCLGGGLQIALGADIRIARPDARLSVMEAKWGLVPDMAITRTLPRLVGIDVAKLLTYTARRISGEQAHALGLVTVLADDPLSAARALAEEIAARSPDAVRAAKRLYEESWTAPAQQSLMLEAQLQLGLIGSPNQLAAVAAGLSRQPAEFADPA
jgi:enoyl-CoA hydratase/carnithine racemase